MTEGRLAEGLRLPDQRPASRCTTSCRGSLRATRRGGPTVAGPFTTLLYAFVPGVGYQKAPEGSAVWVPGPAAACPSRRHYTTYGKATTEEHQNWGLYFLPKGEETEVPAAGAWHPRQFHRDYGRAKQSTKRPLTWNLPKDAVIYGFQPPHSHKAPAVSANVLHFANPNGQGRDAAGPCRGTTSTGRATTCWPSRFPRAGRLRDHHPLDLRQLGQQPGKTPIRPRLSIGASNRSRRDAGGLLHLPLGRRERAKAPREDYESVVETPNVMMGNLDDNMDGKIEFRRTQGRPIGPGPGCSRSFFLADRRRNHDGRH